MIKMYPLSFNRIIIIEVSTDFIYTIHTRVRNFSEIILLLCKMIFIQLIKHAKAILDFWLNLAYLYKFSNKNLS